VQQVDWLAGQVVADIAEAGLADNTLLLFLSDNGPALYHGVPSGSVGLFTVRRHERGHEHARLLSGSACSVVASLAQ
jgi:arylsulfatase A-like enzyme